MEPLANITHASSEHLTGRRADGVGLRDRPSARRYLNGLELRSGPRLSAQTHRPQLTQNGEPGPVVTTEGPPLDATHNGAAPRKGIPHLGTEPTAISQPRPSFRRR